MSYRYSYISLTDISFSFLALEQIVHKRRVALAKSQGNIAVAIEWLNKYLET